MVQFDVSADPVVGVAPTGATASPLITPANKSRTGVIVCNRGSVALDVALTRNDAAAFTGDSVSATRVYRIPAESTLTIGARGRTHIALGGVGGTCAFTIQEVI